MEKKRSISLEQLLQAVALGNTETEVISSIAARFARLEKKIGPEEKAELQKLACGKSLKELTGDLVQAIDPDKHIEQAKKDNPGVENPSREQIRKSEAKVIQSAVIPLHKPDLRKRLVELHKTMEQTIDVVSKDDVLVSSFSAEA